MKKLNIGMVGYGFMGRTHSNAFRKVGNFFSLPVEPVLKTICARNADRANQFAATWGYESVVTDWRKLVESPEIDLIDVASPNDTHAEIAIAAARAGKMIMCEKPLGRNAREAEAMVNAVESAGVANTVWYNYRRVPAVTLAKQLIDEGRLGKNLSLPREISSGLDDRSRSAAGRRRTMAAGCKRSGQRGYRRFVGPRHRHRDVAQRACR